MTQDNQRTDKTAELRVLLAALDERGKEHALGILRALEFAQRLGERWEDGDRPRFPGQSM